MTARINVETFTGIEWETNEPAAVKAQIWQDANNGKWGYTLRDRMDDWIPILDSGDGFYESRDEVLLTLIRNLVDMCFSANMRVLEATKQKTTIDSDKGFPYGWAELAELRRRVTAIEIKMGINNASD